MGTLLMAAVVLFSGAGLMFWALYLLASPGTPEPTATKTVWVPVGGFFMDEAEAPGSASLHRSQMSTLRLEEHVRREHAAAANFLSVLTPESLHASIDPSQMD